MMSSDPLFQPLTDKFAQPESAATTVSLGYWREVWRRFRLHRIAMVCLIFLCALTLFAIFGPMLSGYTYYSTHLELHNTPPGRQFLFGSDELGRDVLTRVAFGARISLFVGFAAAFVDLVIGVLYGGIAGFAGGRLDALMMRIADILYAIPYLLIVILLIVFMGTGLATIIIALSITGWIGMARMVRGQMIQLKRREFVLAARALGASSSRVLWRHLIPNAMGPIIVMMTFTVPTAIFTEAFLSFMGLGIQAPVASWGTMANDALAAMRYYPWRLAFPAGFISATMLAFYVVGDALRDAIDPRLR